MEPLAVALLQHNKQFDTPAYISFRVGCDVSECALLERVCLPAAGPAAGGAREVVSPSEYRFGVTGCSTAAAQETVRDMGLHEFRGRALFVEARTSRKGVFTCCWACRWGPARGDVA